MSGAGNGSGASEKGKTKMNKVDALIRPEVTDDFGPWMIAVKQRRKYVKNQERKNQNGSSNGNNDYHSEGKRKNQNGKESS